MSHPYALFSPFTNIFKMILNPSNAEATYVQSRMNFWKPSKSCHVGIEWKAVAEYSQMSTHVPGIQSVIFPVFCIILY